MPWLRWLPWRFILRRVARAHGFLDPIALLARVQGLAQPSEVEQPIELLRAGVVFHARGLINSRVIQHNLDWIWPYWIERQFDPEDPSFVPRAFSATHINLTHRNWTAIGLPNVDALPIVDPRGLLTPHFDGWSLDGWVIGDDGERLLPSKAAHCQQRLELENGLAISSTAIAETMTLTSKAWVDADGGDPVCRLKLDATSDHGGWLVVALRPYNPEGVSFLHRVRLADARDGWVIDDSDTVHFDGPADRHHVSDYRHGDVAIHLQDLDDETEGLCDVGLVTAATMFRIEPGASREVILRVPLEHAESSSRVPANWTTALDGCCRLTVPDDRVQFLFDTALRTLVLHAPLDVYPGPFTYKRFWFRDAAFIINALLAAGLHDRAERAIDQFPDRQRSDGYFHSQDGEWDSNGAALWIMERFQALTGRPTKHPWRKPILNGAGWIAQKRHDDNLDAIHAGLLPAGFSAEHLGPNDFYYWDDFLGVAGLRAASALAETWGDKASARDLAGKADAFVAAIDRSLSKVRERLGRPALPASPYRRLDAGAVGSLVAGYPLQLHAPDDPRLLGTVEFLLQNCMVKDGFFQDMIHSGINPYLTLHMAEVLLRNDDPRYLELLDAVAASASPTGQWPEAIHPHTGGGCMGDGQHVWAAAEWIMMIRHCFVREEDDGLILCQGIAPRWLVAGKPLEFGPAPTAFGPMTIHVSVNAANQAVRVSWDAVWRDRQPPIDIRLPSFPAMKVGDGQTSVELARMAA
ncbi:MAG: hypothetical protein OEU92_12995 [Alphaproteobacteria bacterium]|nr:hypothetical protein [Alphaproteobacteria bacterium]